MTSLKQLQREKQRLLQLRNKEIKRQTEINKRKDLQREIFMLKHGKKIDAVKKGVGSLRGNVMKFQKWADKRQSPRRKSNNSGYGSLW